MMKYGPSLKRSICSSRISTKSFDANSVTRPGRAFTIHITCEGRLAPCTSCTGTTDVRDTGNIPVLKTALREISILQVIPFKRHRGCRRLTGRIIKQEAYAVDIAFIGSPIFKSSSFRTFAWRRNFNAYILRLVILNLLRAVVDWFVEEFVVRAGGKTHCKEGSRPARI